MKERKNGTRSAWSWVPSLYFAEGVPNTIVCVVSIIIFKQFGMSNSETAFFSGFLAFPWILKPLWTPLVDMYWSKKFWSVAMQFAMGGCFVLSALIMPFEAVTRLLIAIFMLLAILSATHDAAADGFYVLGLSPHQQAFFTGVRGTFYRIAMIVAQGVVVVLAGTVQQLTGLKPAEFELAAAPGETAAQVLALDNGDLKITASRDTLHRADAGLFKAWTERVGQYNASPSGTALAELTGSVPEGAALLAVELSRPLADGEKRQLSLELSDSGGDISVFHGERLVFTGELQRSGLPLLAAAGVNGNVSGAGSRSKLKIRSGNMVLAWTAALGSLGVLYMLLALYHWLVMPRDAPAAGRSGAWREFFTEFGEAFVTFFRKKHIVGALTFILLYRFAESQLLKLAVTFVIDPADKGGLALSNSEYGVIYGTVGILSLVAGGLLGGWALSRQGLRFWLLPMALALNLPDAVYLAMSLAKPTGDLTVAAAVIVEQFGYGFGFSSYMLFMVYFANDSGKYATSHFAIMTGLQAVGLMLPGMASGWIQENLFNGAYPLFFGWVMAATLVSFGATFIAMGVVPADFGRPVKAAQANR